MKKIFKRVLKIGLVILLIPCVFIGILLFPFCSVAISSCGRNGCANDKEKNAREYVKKVLEMELPKEAELLYNYEPENPNVFPVPGRAEDYFVFGFENTPTEWLQKNSFSAEKSVEYEDDFLNGGFGFTQLNMATKIPEAYKPDFDKPYFWLEKDCIYLTYFSDPSTLIIFVKPG